MGRKSKTATAEKSLPLPFRLLAAWIGMWLGEHHARVIEYQRAEKAALLLDANGGFLRGKRYLILDRDPLYTKEFRSRPDRRRRSRFWT